ncbi:TetR family transcriptional regulator ActII [Kribbella jejuensis]|uniref:TetR family transcriptional regulator n=1 Tax=Kribbella jejuensis TaxID=236068 RepID=A0A542END2_9ACTN|nr:TetR/AcrR family transcriptional regulator [Kribbella jejuensis]TQJ16860.1 TetR family transcriptional regulator [Kribbella jejuensis]
MEHPVKAGRKRRPRGSLTRQQVVDTALELADAEGLEALTMPTLARRLDCGVMTIYGYVDSKEDLLDAIAQRGLRDLRLPRPLPAGTAPILVAWGRALRLNLIDHPSLPMIFLSRAVIGPGILHGLEAVLGRLAEAGMPPARGVHAIYAILTYATGFVAWEMPRTRRQSRAAYAASWRREVAGLPPGHLPLVAGILDELPEVAGESQFELGLTALATGLTLNPGN